MFACEICDRQFYYKNSVNRHFRREHINKETRRRLKCTECDHECRFYHDLRTHIYVEHGIVCKVERRMFTDIEEFNNWKRNFEETSHFMYVKHSSAKISVTSNERKTYFVCHRTGTFQSGSCGKRKLKQQGSNKINASCPSTMEVVESLNDGTVKLVLWKTHAGHNAEISRTFLSATERNWLAARISEGASQQKIMNEIQKMDNKGSRMCFIKGQDIRNMKKNLINSRNRVLLSDVRSWVNAAQSLASFGESPVLYFKDKNDTDLAKKLPSKDIMLIVMTEFQEKTLKNFGYGFVCVDATHCLEDYDYQLITVYVANDSIWYPIVYCITSVVNQTSIRHFLLMLREKVGKIYCNVFVSDDDPPFYQAWCEVMSKPQHRFISLWYLEKEWKENVLKISCSDKMKTMVFSSLKCLSNELDEKSFEKKLFSLLGNLSRDSQWTDFISYFQNEFVIKKELWASCYSKSVGFTFDSRRDLEKLHRKLYDEYHSGLNAQCLKNCLNSLILISRNCETTSKIISTECRNNLRRIQLRHRRGVCIKRSAIAEVSSTLYKISVDDAINEVYQVRWLDPQNCKCSCRCHICRICVHECSCSCVDYVANFSICEHIHACAILRNNIVIDLSSETDEPLDTFIEEVICEEEIICNVEDVTEETYSESVTSEDKDELTFVKYEEFNAESENSTDIEDSPEAVELNEEICSGIEMDADINFENVPKLYYGPFAFVESSDMDDFGRTEFELTQDDLQIVAFNEDDDYEGLLVNDDDSSSFGDASSVYEDIIPQKGAIIALGFGDDPSDNYIFRRVDDNTILRHKVDTLFTLGEFESAEDGNLHLPMNTQIGSFESDDFHSCYANYTPTDEDGIVFTL